MKKYPPLFGRIELKNKNDEMSGLSKEFNDFWYSIQKKCGKNPEKTQALRKLQECYFWFSRAICLDDFAQQVGFNRDDLTKPGRPIPHYEELKEQETRKKKMPEIHYKSKRKLTDI